MRIKAGLVAALSAWVSIAGCGAQLVADPDDGGVDGGSVPDARMDAGSDAGAMACATGCLVGTTCHPDGTVSPTNECEVCDHAVSRTSFSANDGVVCDDGFFCTTGDVCAARACSGTARTCDDAIACNGVATCDEAAGACTPGTTTCATGELCDALSGACVTTCGGCTIGTNCFGDGQLDPGNPCQACDVLMSRSAFSANDGEICDDGSFCTTGDVCAARVCAGAGARCGDSIDCNGAETCDESADACLAGTTPCAASEICDALADACVASCSGCDIGGVCFGPGQRNPLSQCEVCAPAISRSAFSPDDGASCDDGLFCTSGDVCTGTSCGGSPRVCSDGIACNGSETCSESGDTCAPGTSTCGGGMSCDPGTDSCVASCAACTIAGSCQGAGQVNPMNSCEVCNTSAPTVWSANDGARCDDGLFCTDSDVCAARACSGTARLCADPVACNGTETCNETTDACVAGTTTCGASQVCSTSTDTCVTTCTGCVVGGTCHAAGATNPVNGCEVCDIARSRTSFSSYDGAPCNDGDFCTRADVCSGSRCAGSTATNFCDDSVDCNGTETCNETTDACVAGATTCGTGEVCNPAVDTCVTTCSGCVIGGVCYAPGTINPTNQCQVCRVTAPSVWTANAGAACNDGLFCTRSDTCSASAVCGGAARDCSDGVACTGVETCNEAGSRCDLGTTACPAGQSCNAPTDTCIVSCAGCVIGGVCYAPGTINPANDCLACRTLMSTTAWTPVLDMTACDDGQYCTISDACSGGSCVAGAMRDCEDIVICNGAETCDEASDTCQPAASTCGPGSICDTSTIPSGMCVSLTAPETTLTVTEPSATTDPTADFEFVSSAPGSTFQCSVDGGAFVLCTTPFSTAPLGIGPHTFAVRAIDPLGTVDPTPASATWTLVP